MSRLVGLVVFLFLASSISVAQFDSGQISGFIHDSSGAVVPGAAVIATNQGNGEQHRTTTNAGGYYVFPNLPVATYSVSVEQQGFKKFVKRDVQLNAAAHIAVDLELA